MNNRPVIAQEWSLHAELTFSHHQPPPSVPASTEGRQHIENGVHMEYSWNSPPEPASRMTTTPSHTLHPCYGFQRGNILFTTTPPSRCSYTQPNHSTANQEQATPGSYGSLPTRRTQTQYNRRCKSTCSIVLSGPCTPDPSVSLNHGCSDPHCYHSITATESPRCGFSPIAESCEVCGGGRSPTAVRRAARTNTFTTHFCTRVPERPAPPARDLEPTVKESRDIASQTSDLPFVCDNWQSTPSRSATGSTATHSETNNAVGIKPEPDLLQLPTVLLADSSNSKSINHKLGKRLVRSPARLRGKSPLLQGRRSQGSQCSLADGQALGPDQRKPRTVHIDVYCTGSEGADASSSTSSDSDSDGCESWSSPQTVFESDKLRVVHTRASKDQLPQALQKGQVPSRKSESFKYESSNSIKEEHMQRGYDSDDGLSSQYPSKQSSYTTLQDEESMIVSDVDQTSRDPSWSTISSSSCALFSDEYDSAAATSCKDTTTEQDSVVQSSPSLAPSDSFEYADAMDRLRIREKEEAWAGAVSEEMGYGNRGAGGQGKTWRSPHIERKHLLQQQKFKEFLQKHLGKTSFPLWKPEPPEDSEEDDEDDEDETGYAWSFGGGDASPRPGTVRRESTVRKAVTSIPVTLSPRPYDSGSLSDSGPPCTHGLARRVTGPFGNKLPSPPPPKLRSTITLPFTTLFGKRTDQLTKAQKFGTIVGAFRKPGHHIGPSKNPECTCEHCRRYYEDSAYRGRTHSVGDVPLEKTDAWNDSVDHFSRNEGGSDLTNTFQK